MTYTIAVCTVKKTPDDGQRNFPKHVEFFFPKMNREISASSWFYCNNLSRSTVTWTSNIIICYVKPRYFLFICVPSMTLYVYIGLSPRDRVQMWDFSLFYQRILLGFSKNDGISQLHVLHCISDWHWLSVRLYDSGQILCGSLVTFMLDKEVFTFSVYRERRRNYFSV